MYYQLYDVLLNGIYGADAVLTSDMELTLTLLSTCGCVLLVCIPFAIGWKLIKRL